MILRKPSASHCVKKLPLETYSPISEELAAGLQNVVSSSVKLAPASAGTASMVSVSPSACRPDTALPSIVAPASSSPSPTSTSGLAAAVRVMRRRLTTRVRSGTRSISSATSSMRNAGAA